MSEKPKTETPTPSGLVPVKAFRLRHPIVIDVGGGDSACSALSSSPPSTAKHWRIYFDPRVRAIRIEFYMADAADKSFARPPAKTVMVPFDWCSWEPVL